MCLKSPKRGLALRVLGDFVEGSVLVWGEVRSRVREGVRGVFRLSYGVVGVYEGAKIEEVAKVWCYGEMWDGAI